MEQLKARSFCEQESAAKQQHVSTIETVLDGSSGGSGFRQKVKKLTIRGSSRNSSIASNQSGERSGALRATDKKSPRVPTLKIPLLPEQGSYSSGR